MKRSIVFLLAVMVLFSTASCSKGPSPLPSSDINSQFVSNSSSEGVSYMPEDPPFNSSLSGGENSTQSSTSGTSSTNSASVSQKPSSANSSQAASSSQKPSSSSKPVSSVYLHPAVRSRAHRVLLQVLQRPIQPLLPAGKCAQYGFRIWNT